MCCNINFMLEVFTLKKKKGCVNFPGRYFRKVYRT